MVVIKVGHHISKLLQYPVQVRIISGNWLDWESNPDLGMHAMFRLIRVFLKKTRSNQIFMCISCTCSRRSCVPICLKGTRTGAEFCLPGPPAVSWANREQFELLNWFVIGWCGISRQLVASPPLATWEISSQNSAAKRYMVSSCLYRGSRDPSSKREFSARAKIPTQSPRWVSQPCLSVLFVSRFYCTVLTLCMCCVINLKATLHCMVLNALDRASVVCVYVHVCG